MELMMLRAIWVLTFYLIAISTLVVIYDCMYKPSNWGYMFLFIRYNKLLYNLFFIGSWLVEIQNVITISICKGILKVLGGLQWNKIYNKIGNQRIIIFMWRLQLVIDYNELFVIECIEKKKKTNVNVNFKCKF